MFRFENPYLLYLLLLVPVVLLVQLFYNRWRRRLIGAQFGENLINQIIPGLSYTKSWIKIGLLCFGITFLILAIANPQSGSKTEEVKRKGIDIMIALDISNSMLAEDLYPNRLARAKRSIQELLGYLKSDRIGIVVFAGQSFVQLPITTDHSAAKLFLNSIETDLIATQGTDIKSAVTLCLESFDPESPAAKSIILISDGEHHEDDLEGIISEAEAAGIVVHSIGMGSEEGAPIPIMNRGKRVGFRQNKTGNTVVTKLNEEMLTSIARPTGGIFVRATNAESGMSYVFEEIEKMEKVELGSKVYTDFDDQFQYFLLPALILLIIELIIPNTRSKWWQKLIASQ
ncbi:MAG: VWA domain-containing protein [Salibacteraceae bacterium]